MIDGVTTVIDLEEKLAAGASKEDIKKEAAAIKAARVEDEAPEDAGAQSESRERAQTASTGTSGWLTKAPGTGMFASSKKRWFVMDKAGCVQYFVGPNKEKKGEFNATGMSLKATKGLSFEVTSGPSDRTYALTADNKDDYDVWMSSLGSVCKK